MREIDDLNFVKRRPWLLLVVAVAVGGLLWLRYARTKCAEPMPPSARSSDVVTATPSTNATASATDTAQPSIPAGVPAATNMDLRLASCSEAVAQGRLQESRTNYAALLNEGLSEAVRRDVEARLSSVNVQLVTTPRAMPEKEDYIVASGDSLDKIAKRFGTTVELIQKSNEHTNSMIRAGDRFRVFKGRFSVAISKSRNELRLMMNGQFFSRYDAGTGKYGKTPAGTFVISDRIKEPVWWRGDNKEIPYGDPENILGTRWLALRATGDTLPVKGYGIHGTWEDASVGKAESAGCVRLRNADVEELFDLLPIGTPVMIEE